MKEGSYIILLLMAITIVSIVFSHLNLIQKQGYFFPDIYNSLSSYPITSLEVSSENSPNSRAVGYFFGFEKECLKWETYDCGIETERTCERCVLYYSALDFEKNLYNYDNIYFNSEINKERDYYWYLSHSTKTNKCEENFKLCGKLDEINNCCVPENEECPITDIKILKQDTYKDYKKIPYKNNANLFYSRETNDTIIVGFNVSEGEMCARGDLINSNKTQFKFDRKKDFYGCKYEINGEKFDKSYTEIIGNGIIRKKFLEDNDLSEIFKNYKQLSNDPAYLTELKLYARRYIGFNKDCLIENNINYETLEDLFNDIENAAKKRRTLATVCLVSGYLMILFLLVFCMIYCPRYTGCTIYCNLVLLMVLICIPFTMNIVSVFVLFPYKTYEFPLCADALTNGKIKDYNSFGVVSRMKLYYSIVFITTFVYLLVFILLILRYKKKVKKLDCGYDAEGESEKFNYYSEYPFVENDNKERDRNDNDMQENEANCTVEMSCGNNAVDSGRAVNNYYD